MGSKHFKPPLLLSKVFKAGSGFSDAVRAESTYRASAKAVISPPTAVFAPPLLATGARGSSTDRQRDHLLLLRADQRWRPMMELIERGYQYAVWLGLSPGPDHIALFG